MNHHRQKGTSNVRRHAKASSAGSTSGGGGGLGSIRRGALAGRDLSLGAEGSGAPSHRARLVLAALLTAAAYFLLAAGLVPRASAAVDPCPNAAFRTGPSADLPDCRAYELVSPANTAGHRPTANNWDAVASAFDFSLISPTADSVMFQSINGPLPGAGGNGLNDRYLATRGPGGWTTEPVGPSAAETEYPSPGGIDAQHAYYFIEIGGPGTGVLLNDSGSFVTQFGAFADLLHSPDGSYQPVAQGSLGSDPTAHGLYISPGADHIIFDTNTGVVDPQIVQLEPDAPPSGTAALYDRSPGGPTRVVSLLPGDVTPSAAATFAGASADGSAVAFTLSSGPNLYVRVDNTDTDEVTAGANTFAGISAQGEHVFYADAATGATTPQTPSNLFSFDTPTQTTTQITNTGDATFVNISADGSRVYLESPSQIGGQGTVGQPNLYVWDRSTSATTFIATLDPGDLSGSAYSTLSFPPRLTGWTMFARSGEIGDAGAYQVGSGAALSRTTPDGSAIVFESAAQLTAYNNAGHQEIYRYDAVTHTRDCVSCGTGAGPAIADASLQGFKRFGLGEVVDSISALDPTANITADGQTVFFQTKQDLLPADSNGRQDVYRWHDGDLALISTGQAGQDSDLYAVSPDGSDVVFLTPQELVPQDQNLTTGALYDARVNGGFPITTGPGPCSGDACQGNPTPPPSDPSAGSSSLTGPGNQGTSLGGSIAKMKCGEHKKLKKGKCVRKKKHHRSRAASTTRRAGQ